MRFLKLLFPVLAIAITAFAFAGPASAASAGVNDEGSFFSKDTIAKAEDLIRDIRQIDNRDVLVVTFAGIPADRQEQFKAKSEQGFYSDWADEIGREHGVNGIVMLLVREPGRLQIEVGSKTRQHAFTLDNRDELRDLMLRQIKAKQDDDALLDGLRFIKDKMKRAANNPAAAAATPDSSPPPYSSPQLPITPSTPSTGFPVGAWLCAGVAILAVVFFIINAASRNRSGGGYGAPPAGGYPQGYSGGYGGGWGGGGGGGGFGSSLLGGILGGALGSWGYDRFNQPNNPTYNPPPPSGGGFGNSSSNDQTDTSYSGTGGDFGSSSPPDSSSSSSDFGSSSSSSDFGSSSDSGGGGDFGSGGGDFGGGGDSGGGSTGGDF